MTPSNPPSGDSRARVALAVALGVTALGLAAMAALGFYAFIWKTAVLPILLVAALAAGRLDRFVDDWAVYLALVVLFDFLRGFVFALVCRFELPMYMNYAIELERIVAGGHILPVALQEMRRGLASSSALDQLLTIVHSSHFAFFLLFGLAVWILRPLHFWRYTYAMLVAMYAGLIGYALLPTVPPWMAANRFHVIPALEHVSAGIYNMEIPSLQHAFDINPIAAMPSLHTALPVLCALIGLHHFGWRAAFLACYAALVCFSIAYLGEHYLIDILAGIALAVAAYLIVYRFDALSAWRTHARFRLRPLVFTVLIIVLAEGVGQLTRRMGGPLPVTRAFVERELVGKTEVAQLYLGQLDFTAGDLRSARRHLDSAHTTLGDPAQRRTASLWLARTVYRQRDFAAAIAVLEPLRDGAPGRESLLLLANAYLQGGRETDGVALLQDLIARFPSDPEPLYWLTRHQYVQRQATRQDVLQVVDRLAGFPDRRRAEQIRGALLGLLQQGDGGGADAARAP